VRHLTPTALQGRGVDELTTVQKMGLRLRESSKDLLVNDLLTGGGRIFKNFRRTASCGSKEEEKDAIAQVAGEVLPALGKCLNALGASGWGLHPLKHVVTRMGELLVFSKCTNVAQRFHDSYFKHHGDEEELSLRTKIFTITSASGRLADALLSLRFTRTIISQIFQSQNRMLERSGKFAALIIELFVPAERLPYAQLIIKALETGPYVLKIFTYIFSSNSHMGLSSYTFSDAFHALRV